MIKFNEIIEDKEYRERVIKFFRLPVRLSVSKDKFLSHLDFIKQTDREFYDKVVSYTEQDFNKLAREQGTNTPDFTMENILEPLLKEIEKKEAWQEFIKKDYSDVLDDYEGITSTHGFYKKENDGKHFVSVDLAAANWQSLQSIVGFKETYEELIVKYTDNLIPPISKTFRTKITGVLGAKKIMDYNKKLLKDNKDPILQCIYKETNVDLRNIEPFAFYADEFLIEVDKDTKDKLNSLNIKALEEKVSLSTGINVHITPFTLKWLNVNKACAKIYKNDYEVLNISKDILLIMNKILHDIQIQEVDFEQVKMKEETLIQKLESAIKVIEGSL